MEIVKSNIANALTSAAKDHVLGVANDIYDESLLKYQSEINQELVDNDSTISKIVEILSTVNGSTNIEKLTAIKATLDGLGNGYKNVVELATTLKNFITDTDATNETINSWKEIENFLQGITDTETLTGLLLNISNKVNDRITSITGVDSSTFLPSETSKYIKDSNNLADAVESLDAALKDIDTKVGNNILVLSLPEYDAKLADGTLNDNVLYVTMPPILPEGDYLVEYITYWSSPAAATLINHINVITDVGGWPDCHFAISPGYTIECPYTFNGNLLDSSRKIIGKIQGTINSIPSKGLNCNPNDFPSNSGGSSCYFRKSFLIDNSIRDTWHLKAEIF